MRTLRFDMEWSTSEDSYLLLAWACAERAPQPKPLERLGGQQWSDCTSARTQALPSRNSGSHQLDHVEQPAAHACSTTRTKMDHKEWLRQW